jgi:hypothetical protein
MRIHVFGSPFRHALGDDYHELDDRLATTRCGILFAWTDRWPGDRPQLPDCAECWS